MKFVEIIPDHTQCRHSVRLFGIHLWYVDNHCFCLDRNIRDTTCVAGKKWVSYKQCCRCHALCADW